MSEFTAPNPAAAAASPPAQPSADQPPLMAVLWDFDGTLVDTEPAWQRAEHAFMAKHGARWTHEEAVSLTGAPWRRVAGAMRDSAAAQGVHIELDDWSIYQALFLAVVEHTNAGEIPWAPGSQQLLQECADAGLELAVASSSPPELLNAVLDRVNVSIGVIVDGQSVSKGKPDPESYLTAAERIGVPIEQCIVLEDSMPGVASGRASGAPVVALQTTTKHEAAPGMMVLDSLAGVSVADLRVWHAELSAQLANGQGARR